MENRLYKLKYIGRQKIQQPLGLRALPRTSLFTLHSSLFTLHSRTQSSLLQIASDFVCWRQQAMAIKSESTPPPMIGKIGPYTVFMTPPSTPKPPESDPVLHSPSPNKISPPPVQPPPPQIQKPVLPEKSLSDGSVLGFFRNAVTKVQTAHSSLDDHLARWFGLNQSKYQWALDDYYESKGMEKGDIKVKEISSKVQSV